VESAGPGREATPVKVVKVWLVYAHSAEPYSLDQCTRSAPLNAGGGMDVRVLRKLVKRHAKKH
jgi:hypothetical protein